MDWVAWVSVKLAEEMVAYLKVCGFVLIEGSQNPVYMKAEMRHDWHHQLDGGRGW